MDEARKRRIPVFCSRVAVVTSLSGAVIDDVKRTLRRRNPLVELVCVGAKVQGEGAPAELIEGLRRAASITPAPDCILLVRGGGSFEDLMTFNDEELARAVAACPVPVVTGIGHEPDTSMRHGERPSRLHANGGGRIGGAGYDGVGRRARGTSSASGRRDGFDDWVGPGRPGDARSAWSPRLGYLYGPSGRCARCSRVPPVPQRPNVYGRAPRIGACLDGRSSVRRHNALGWGLPLQLRASARALGRKHLGARWQAPCAHARKLRLEHQGRTMLSRPASDLGRAAASLDALSPLKVLARGYSIAYSDDGVATSAQTFKPGDAIRVRMADGNVSATVNAVE